MRIPFRSCSYPSGHWSAMNTPWFTCGRSSSFCHWSSVSVGGRAWSPVRPFSAAVLVYLSVEGLDHCCGCSSSLSTANLMHLSGEELVHRCHHVSVQIQRFVLCVLLVQPLLSVLCRLQVWVGNVQVWGFMLGEHGRLHSSAGLCVS